LKSGLKEIIVEEKNVTYNNKTSEVQILEEGNRKTLEGLYGCGIAWPEQTVDPKGNVEYAVGLAKFMNHAIRVIPEVVLRNLRMQEVGKGKL
jgi:hypothetical protein